MQFHAQPIDECTLQCQALEGPWLETLAVDTGSSFVVWQKRPNAQGKRRRSTEGAEGTNKGRENAEGMALVGVRLTDQLGHEPCCICFG